MKRRTLRARATRFAATLGVVILGSAATVRAECVTPDGCTPAGSCAYWGGTSAFAPSTWKLNLIQSQTALGCVALPQLTAVESDVTLGQFFGLSSDPGNMLWSYGAGTAHLVVRVLPASGGVYPVEVLAYDLTGFPLPSQGGVHLDPSRPSTGQITATPEGTMLRVESTFDLFLEVDRADGESPIPAVASNAIVLAPIAGDPVRSSTWGSLKLHYR